MKLLQLREFLFKAREAATMDSAHFGFDTDLVVEAYKDSHGGVSIPNDHESKSAKVHHVTDFIVNKTKPYRETWIMGPIDQAIEMVEAEMNKAKGKRS